MSAHTPGPWAVDNSRHAGRPMTSPSHVRLATIAEVAVTLGLSRSGFDKLRAKDPTFPRPLKDGVSQQARVRFDFAEVSAWTQGRKDARPPSKMTTSSEVIAALDKEYVAFDALDPIRGVLDSAASLIQCLEADIKKLKAEAKRQSLRLSNYKASLVAARWNDAQ